MAKIKFELLKTHKDISLETLEFEGDGSDINNTSGEVTRNIIGFLDINISVSGTNDTIGKTWTLIVSVNGKPIITKDGTGSISGTVGKNKSSGYFGAHGWYV